MSEVPQLKPKLMTTKTKQGVSTEFQTGTIESKFTVIHILMNLHNNYNGWRVRVDNVVN